MITPLAVHTTIASADDLTEFWGHLIGPEPIDTATLWLVPLDQNGRTVGVAIPIDDMPLEPDVTAVRGLAAMLDEVLAACGAGSVVLLLARPGRPTITTDDRRWATLLHTHFGSHLGTWPVHLATHLQIQPLTPDDAG